MIPILRVAAFGLIATFAVATGEAAVLNFTGMTSGTTSQNTGPFTAGKEFRLFVDYNTSAGASGSVNNSTLEIDTDTGTKTFVFGSSSTGTASDGQLSILAGNKDLKIDITYRNGAAVSGQPTFGSFSLTFTAGTAVGGNLSLENVAGIVRPTSSYLGTISTFLKNDGGEERLARFAGTIPVPEPGSISLLAGLGLVCGRRVWRRRQQKQAAAV